MPAYRLTWAGMLPSQMAINMGEVATPYAAFVLTGEATAIGLVNLAAGIPMMAFTLVGGVVADRLPRRAILLSAQGLALVGTALLAWVVLSGRLEVWHLAAFAALQGTVFAFNNPSYQAFVAELVPRRMLRSAIALNMTGFNLSRVVGPSVAGLLLSVPMLGLAAVYVVMAALNGVALASLSALRRQHALARPAVTREPVARVSGWAQLTEGLRYVVSVPILRTLLLMGLIPVLFAFPVQAMLPIFSERVYESGPVGLGILSASVGLGALSGSVVGAGLSQHNNPIRLQIQIGGAARRGPDRLCARARVVDRRAAGRRDRLCSAGVHGPEQRDDHCQRRCAAARSRDQREHAAVLVGPAGDHGRDLVVRRDRPTTDGRAGRHRHAAGDARPGARDLQVVTRTTRGSVRDARL